MHSLTTGARHLGLAALLAAALAPAAAAAEVPTAADRADRAGLQADALARVPVAADAGDRRTVPTAVPVQADAADRVPSPPVAADAPDRVPAAVPVAAVPIAADAADRRLTPPAAPADDGLPVAAPLGLLALLGATAVGAVVLRRSRRVRPATAGAQHR